ncbi:MAG: lipocalin family protein [Deltaproteobacteria bacterium]|nr:lipocalin family protein [Deltaproteobacteria bacterium]
MKKAAVLLAASLLLLPLAANAASKINGKWKVVSMTKQGKTIKSPPDTSIVLAFEDDGKKWTVTMKAKAPNGQQVSQSMTGKFSMKGNKVTTTNEKTNKTETMVVAFKGKTMTMTKGEEKMVAEKVD